MKYVPRAKAPRAPFSRPPGAIAGAKRADGSALVVRKADNRAIVAGKTVVARTAFPIDDIAVVDDRWLVAGAYEGTLVFDLEQPSLGAVDTLPGTGSRVRPEPALGTVAGGRVLWLRPTSQRTTAFYVVDRGKLRRAATLPIGLALAEVGGQVLAHAETGWLTVTGVGALVKAATPAPVKQTAALRAVDKPPPRPLPADDFTRRIKREVTWYRVHADGRTIVYDGIETSETLWLDARGRLQRFALDQMPRTLDLATDGEVLVAHSDSLLVIRDGKPKRVKLELADVRAAFYVANERIAVLADSGLYLVTRAGAIKASGTVAKPWYALTSGDGRRVAVVCHAKIGLVVFDVSGAKPRAVLRAPIAVADAYASGDRLFVRTATGAWFEA